MTAVEAGVPPPAGAEDERLDRDETELGLYSWLRGFTDQPHPFLAEHGMTVADMLALHRRPAAPAGAVYRSRVAYGTAGSGGRPLHLYLYARADTGERRPGVVLIHGGGWHEGTPFMLIRHAAELAAAGYVTATIEYRLLPEACWPQPVEDCKAAVRWLRANHASLGLDPARIAVLGNSAGGHLAAVAALTPGRLDGDGGNAGVDSAAQAVVLLYPAIDTFHPANPLSLQQTLAQLVGSAEAGRLAAANPPQLVSAAAPPFLSLTAADDGITPLAMVADFHELLVRTGVESTLIVEPAGDHGFDIWPWALPGVVRHITAFLDRALGGAAASGSLP